MKKGISFWLMPEEGAAKALRTAIDSLAAEVSAPTFPPHLTVFSSSPFEAADREVIAAYEGLLPRLSEDFGPLLLKPLAVRHSDLFTQTLVIDFELLPALQALSDWLHKESPRESDYVLKPHLSLLYKSLDASEREPLVGQVSLDPSPVSFSSICKVLHDFPVSGPKAVETWEVGEAKPLRGS